MLDHVKSCSIKLVQNIIFIEHLHDVRFKIDVLHDLTWCTMISDDLRCFDMTEQVLANLTCNMI